MFKETKILGVLVMVFLLALISHQNYAQEKNIDTQAVSWWCYFGTHRLTDKWSIWTELQLRRADFTRDWQQVLPRIGLNYHLNNNVILTAGYGYIWTYPYGEQPIPLEEPRYEHRPWQQVTLLNESGKVSFQHRFRLEQRFLQNWSDLDQTTNLRRIEEGFELQNRMRYRFLLTVPLTFDVSGMQKIFVTGYNEIFVNFGDNIGFNLFDQNRLGATLGYQITKAFSIQTGYMNQVIQKANGRDVENNHALTLFVSYNLDFRNN
jgi:Protein of unknown function (DUF2490)